MSQRTLYKCDRCGKEDAALGLARIVVNTSSPFSTGPSQKAGEYGYVPVPAAVEWCFDCCKAVGVIAPFSGKPPIENVAPAPTMEELLREMLREIVREEMPQC